MITLEIIRGNVHVLVETDTLRVFTRTSSSKNQFLQSLPYFVFLLIIVLLKFRAGFLGCFSFVVRLSVRFQAS